MTFDEWWAGKPLQYYGLGKHAQTLFTATISRPPDLPLPAMNVRSDGGPSILQLIGEARGRAVFAGMSNGAAKP